MAKGQIKNRTKKSATVTGQGNSNNELRQADLQIKDLKKSLKSQLAAMQTEFKRKIRSVAADAYRKALADVTQETSKRTQAKAKLLRETGLNFDKNFQSKFAATVAAPAKKARKGKATSSKKKGRAAKK